ncbi:MAG: class I SAM-dependent methyltransferase [Acidobacteria bacterium]|nr:class I SAM-dependent methyltransferase [Acidobacteriota bacterium]
MAECLFCKIKDVKIVFREFGIDYYRCRKCGHLYSSFERDADYDGYFETIDNEDQAINYWNESHKKMYESFAKKYLKGKRGKILDVGAGLGYFVKFVENQEGWNSYGVEISKGGWRFAKEKLKVQNFFCGRLEDTDFESSSFDIITMWDVLEHLLEPRSILRKIRELLKNDGFLFLHTPNGEVQLLKSRLKKIVFGEREGIHFLEAKDHLNLYSEDTAKKLLLEECGFKSLEFVHLPPIQAVAGRSGNLRVFLKNCWWISASLLHFLTLKKINYDNLFIIAKK